MSEWMCNWCCPAQWNPPTSDRCTNTLCNRERDKEGLVSRTRAREQTDRFAPSTEQPPKKVAKTTKSTKKACDQARCESKRGRTEGPSPTEPPEKWDLSPRASESTRIVSFKLGVSGDGRVVATLSHLDGAVRALKHYVADNADHLFTKQHRDGKDKNKFSLKGSFKVGLGSTQPGNKQHIGKIPHFRAHNFKNKAVFLQDVCQQMIVNAYQKRAYELAKAVIELLDPKFAKGEFLVNFSHMNSRCHYVKKHVDRDDVTFQYILSFGEYDGDVLLSVYDKRGLWLRAFNCKDKILKFDGRLPHRVHKHKFHGDRFAVIWYKSYDARITEATPIFDQPHFVYSP